VIEGHKHHADEGLHEDAQAVDEQQGGGLLDGDDVEEAVDEFGAVVAVKGVGADAEDAPGDVGGDAGKDAALQDFNNPGRGRRTA
jgi:hypothetical protein